MKKFIIIIIILSVLLSIYLLNIWIGGNRSAIEVRVGIVESGSLEQIVQASGQIEPAETIIIRVEVEGNIIDKPVREGDAVSRGSILLRVDQEKLKKEVLNAEIRLTRLEANLNNLVEITGPFEALQLENNLTKMKIALDYTEKNLASMKRIYEEEVITRRQLEDAERAFENARLDYAVALQKVQNQKIIYQKELNEIQGDIQMAQAELRAVKQKLDKTTITAPISGTIVEDILQEKKYVGFGEEIFVIGDISKFQAKVKVDELDIGKVRTGQFVILRSDAFKDAELTGQVMEIAAQATRKTFAEIEVTVQIDNINNQPVRPNLSVDADIQTNKIDNILRVPVESIVKIDNKNYLFLVDNNQAKQREVITGESNQNYIIIESGVSEGEQIVIQGGENLKNNARLKIKSVKSESR